jgi:hypothetical protein
MYIEGERTCDIKIIFAANTFDNQRPGADAISSEFTKSFGDIHLPNDFHQQ